MAQSDTLYNAGKFLASLDENLSLMENRLNTSANFDILRRDVLIGGRKAGFFFIDGFVQEDMVEKLIQFFYSLKEDDLRDLDTFLERGMPYTEAESCNEVEKAVTMFLSGVTLMMGLKMQSLLTAGTILQEMYRNHGKTECSEAPGMVLLRLWFIMLPCLGDVSGMINSVWNF